MDAIRPHYEAKRPSTVLCARFRCMLPLLRHCDPSIPSSSRKYSKVCFFPIHICHIVYLLVDLVRIYIAYCEIPSDIVQQGKYSAVYCFQSKNQHLYDVGAAGVRGAYAASLRVKKEILKLFVVFSEGCAETGN
jgi:hypothetical protein